MKLNLRDPKNRGVVESIENAISNRLKWKLKQVVIKNGAIYVDVSVDDSAVAELYNYDEDKRLDVKLPSHMKIQFRLNHNDTHNTEQKKPGVRKEPFINYKKILPKYHE